MKTILRFGFLLAAVIAAVLYFTRKDTSAAYMISATNLSEQYGSNEIAADSLYLGKKLKITGILIQIEADENQHTWVIQGSGDTNIRVEFPVEHIPAPLPSGSEIMIEGKCAGFLLDVIITEAQIIKNEES